MSGLGLAGLLVALILAIVRVGRSLRDRRRAYVWVVLAYKLVVLGVVLYSIGQSLGSTADDSRLPTVLQVVWPALILLGLMPAVAMELAIGSMERTPTLEIWRVRLAARSAWIMATAVIGFAALNFTANTWNHKIDVSYFKTTNVGTATQALLDNLTEPVTFTLFFPPGNDVLSRVRQYVDTLARNSDYVSIEVLDQATEPERAKALKVRANGAVVIHRSDKSESLLLPLDAEDARDKLRNLDTDIQQRLIRVLKPPRIAYVTTGHMERDFVPNMDDKRLGLQDFKHWLETLGFAVKRLGLAEGLGAQVPTDASVVVIAGPTAPFTDVERKTLHAYLAQGGKLLAAMDPEHGAPDDALLAPLGVRVTPALIANAQAVVRYEGHGESKYDLWTNRLSPHPTVRTLEQNAGRQVVMLMGAGNIVKTAPKPTAPRVTFTVHAMPKAGRTKTATASSTRLARFTGLTNLPQPSRRARHRHRHRTNLDGPQRRERPGHRRHARGGVERRGHYRQRHPRELRQRLSRGRQHALVAR